MKFAVVVPIYNEEKRVFFLINEIKKLNHKVSTQVDFFLVDDGSSDDTSKILSSICKNLKFMHSCSYQKNRGKGYAVRFGMHKALETNDYEFIGMMDADVATPLYHIINVALSLSHKEDVDFLIGDRSESKYRGSFYREISSFCFNLISRLVLSHKYNDTQAGFKFYSRSFCELVVKNSFVYGFTFDVEHLLIAEKGQKKVES